MKSYIPRMIEQNILTSAKTMPVIAMTGPRQSGKTTLAKKLFPSFLYLNLEFPDVRAFAESDPRGFLTQSKTMIVDEIQRVPDLFSYVQGLIDEDSERKYVLTGSNDFALIHNISQSLAGRVALFTVLPFSLQELRAAGIKIGELSETMFRGLYPRVIADENDPRQWYQSYTQTYLERDVRDTSSIHMIDRFYSFLRVVATRAGSILNYSELAKEVGIVTNTAKDWISILQASYIVHVVEPYHANVKKRLVKSPKIYFYDTGLLCSLLGVTHADNLSSHPNIGMIFENFVIGEYAKSKTTQGNPHGLYFYRDHSGKEVDLVIENSGIQLVEIKLGKTFSSDWTAGMDFFDKEIKKSNSQTVVYGGDSSRTFQKGSVVSWKDI